jgi:hypothetical protein
MESQIERACSVLAKINAFYHSNNHIRDNYVDFNSSMSMVVETHSKHINGVGNTFMYQRFSFDENHMLHYEVSDTYGLKCIHK